MPTMPERMAAQEVLMIQVREDVSEVRTDVKTLLAAYNQSKGRNLIFRAVPWAALVAAIASFFIK